MARAGAVLEGERAAFREAVLAFPAPHELVRRAGTESRLVEMITGNLYQTTIPSVVFVTNLAAVQ